MDGSFNLAVVRSVATPGSRVVGAVDGGNFSCCLILVKTCTGDNVPVAQPDRIAGEQAEVFRRWYFGKVIAFYKQFAGKGHLTRIDELKQLVRKLPDPARKRALKELDARYEELKIDKRLERLDAAVAENERRIRSLTLEAQQALAHYDYRKLVELMETAEKLQTHNNELFRAIDRTEQKLARVAQEIVQTLGGGGRG